MKIAPLLAAGALLGAALPLHAGPAYIAASTTAQSSYTKAKFPASTPPVAQAYLFFQGQLSRGEGHDKALEGTPFPTVARMLAADLRSANFQPTPDAGKAELVLAVQWGVTAVQSDPLRDFATQSLQSDLSSFNTNTAASMGISKPTGVGGSKSQALSATIKPASAINMDLSAADAGNQAVVQSTAYNAQLLGFAEDIAKSKRQVQGFADSHSKGDELLDLLNDPRYFLVIQAYDLRQLQKGGHPMPLWTSRVSVQAAGHTFTEILPALCREAARYAGRSTGEVKTDAVDLQL